MTVRAHDKVRQAVDLLQEHWISQAPVVREDSTEVARSSGSIRERELLDRVFRDPDALQADVAEVMAPPIPMVEFDEPVETAFAELERHRPCSSRRAASVLGVLTRSDLLDFLAHRRRTPSERRARRSASTSAGSRQGPRPRRDATRDRQVVARRVAGARATAAAA